MDTPWHKQTITELMKNLSSREYGLTSEEAKERLEKYGANILPEGQRESLFSIFLHQFKSPLIYLLCIAALIILLLDEATDAGIIFFVLIFNAIIGTIQEGKAQNTLLALKKFSQTNATVFRDGNEEVIPDSDVVVGDVIALIAGEKIPADARIIIANNLKSNESALTGESEPVHKISEEIPNDNISLGDQKNMVFKGTNIVAGNGKALVVSTGSNTHFGGIAQKILGIESEMPLQKNIASLSRAIIIAVACISLFIFLAGIAGGNSAREMFAIVVSLSVSIIPEGLPVVVTLILATGVWRMSKQNALVKKLQAVESLGQAQVIAVDKTGTITKNELSIQKVYVEGKTFDVSGIGYEPKGEISLAGETIDAVNHPELLFAGKIAAFCADANTTFLPERQEWRITGDPTEAAMLVFSQKLGFHKEELESESPVVAEIPFDYSIKYHAMVHNVSGKKLLTVVGAPETILGLSEKIWHGGKSHPLSQEERNDVENQIKEMSSNGLRVIAFAETHDVPELLEPTAISNITFVGLFGIKDTLRPEASAAVERAESSGIRVVMITGDHVLTAQAIAKEAGIYHDGDHVLTGKDVETLTPEELGKKLPQTTVFARVNPEHKLKIIDAYKACGITIAMTGDGVNDAPSLVAADLGIAMGKIGTEVAKEAADIVLLDDNFGSIISAVEEGRSIYRTIKKVILYLFSTSIGEVLVIAGALFLGYPPPLLAAQIIWLNFVTDGFLDIALAMEPREKGLIYKKFKKPSKYIVDKLMLYRMFVMALPMMIGTLYLFSQYHQEGADMSKAWTISLTTLAVFQWFNAWNCRFEDKSIFRSNPFSNPFLIFATLIVMALQMLAIYHPAFQSFLHTSPLTLSEWLVIIPVASSIIFAEELRKFLTKRDTKKPLPMLG